MDLIKDISEFVFLANAPEKADIIFVPGGAFPQPSELAAELYVKEFAPLIMPSGRHSVLKGKFMGVAQKQDIYNKDYADEWAFMQDVLVMNGVNEDDILLENRAENTYQNAMYSREEIDRLGLTIERAIICCKAQHSRRCFMYYQLYFPDTEFIICPVVVNGVSKNDWYKTEKGKKSVMGEMLRIGQQFGDLL